MDDPEKAPDAFQVELPGRQPQEGRHPVHHTWHWAFRRLRLDTPKVTSEQIEESTIDRIYLKTPIHELEFLLQPASPFPEWRAAVKAGSEETTILGVIGPRSRVFPVGGLDILQMRDALRIPKARPTQAN